MAQEQTTVPNIFRRAQALKRDNPQLSYKDLKARLVDEFKGGPFPPTHNLTIPEQDARAPEEDWTAGLSLVMRGIQRQDWPEIMTGIVLSLEQTERYEAARGPNSPDNDWHDRTVGIRGSLEKGVSKWMPEELMRLAERKSRES